MTVPTARTRASVGVAILAVLAGACSAGGAPESGVGRGTAAAPPTSAAPVTGLPGWQPRAGLHVPRDDFASAVVGREIWVFGGMTGDRGTRLESIEVYDTRTDTWRTSKVTMPKGLASFEAAAVGDEIFVFGGLDHSSRASTFSARLDTSTGRWHRLPPLPVPRYAHTVTFHDGRIYVIGGEGAGGPVRDVDVFDPKTERWSKGTPMPRPRGSHDAVSAGDVIYVLGGWRGAGPSRQVQTYDPVAERWAAAAPLPEPVSRGGAAVLEGRLWVSVHQLSWVLDLDEGSWSPANPLSVSRHGLGYLPVGDRIYGIGGCLETPLRDVRSVDVLDLG